MISKTRMVEEPNRNFETTLSEGIDDPDALAVVLVGEIFRIDLAAAGGAGCGENSAVPEGKAVSLTERERPLQHRDRGLLNPETQPGLDQRNGMSMGETVRAGGTGRLDVEFLENLNR